MRGYNETMSTRRWVGGACWVAAAVVSVVACGGGKPPVAPQSPATVAKAGPNEVREKVVPHVCGNRAKISQLLGKAENAPAPPPEVSAESSAPPTSLGGKDRLQGNKSYRLVAPSTAFIRTDRGMGSGVVVDTKGYVLTNFHVVADGLQKDLTVKVNVSFGDLTGTGRMQRQEKSYDAVVVKADSVRDLALIRVMDPPKLSAVSLAKSAPQIAERVMSVGHAGIGFLWAAKTCSVASIGERQQDSSVLAGLDCTKTDPSKGMEEANRQKKACDEQKKRMTEAFNAKTQGLAVQTDCAITHGDSGGPLVNGAGELVGLNQSISADLATASFHVHLDEIRDFLGKHGEEAIAVIPDPYCDGGTNPTLEDIDLDGIPDTLVTKGGLSLLSGFDRMSLLIDLDQDHFTSKGGHDGFDAEIALLTVRDRAYVWYDTDGDRRFDLLLVDEGNDGKPDMAYTLDAEGRAKADKSRMPERDLDALLIKDRSLHARLGRIAMAIGATRYTSPDAMVAARAVSIPDHILGGGNTGRVVDTDDNGKPDLVFVRGAFSRGFLIDADEDSLGSLKPGDAADDLLKARKVNPNISVIVQANTVWAIYDTDNDKKPDLALMTTNGIDETWLYATNAWKIGPNKEMTPAPDHVGRKLLRPGLVAMPRALTAFKGSKYDVAKDEAAGTLPDPLDPKGDFKYREVKGFPKGMVIESQMLSSNAILVDLDRDTKLPKDANLEKFVNDGSFDTEVAVVTRGGSEWIYYDTDLDRKFDLVLFVPSPGKEPTQAYRLVKNSNGTTSLEPDPKSIPGRPIRHKSVFKNKAMAAKWKSLASKLFKPSSIEE